MFGAVVSSSSPAVAARCIFARPGVGAACSQNVTDPRLGPRMLDLLAKGLPARGALDEVVAEAAHIEFRQLCLVGTAGHGAAYSGAKALGRHSSRIGTDCVAAGNLLAAEDVPGAMVKAFDARPGSHLGDRLIGALQAAVAAGGEAGPVHSAGLVLVHDVPWNVADLRVDWAEYDPVSELAALWEIYRPQLDDYVQRALDPSKAPSYPVK
ncbi:MAG: DUF1028 domain-containing protein [Candidatus Dormibacteraceae bacterium]